MAVRILGGEYRLHKAGRNFVVILVPLCPNILYKIWFWGEGKVKYPEARDGTYFRIQCPLYPTVNINLFPPVLPTFENSLYSGAIHCYFLYYDFLLFSDNES
jgi:hypothetical protein